MKSQDLPRDADATGTLRRVGFVCAASSALFGFVALAAWQLGLNTLRRWGGGYVAVAPDTSLCFLLLGAAMLFQLLHPGRTWFRVCILVCSVGTILMSVVSLSAYFFGTSFNLVHSMFPASSQNGNWVPGMSPLTALVLSAAGVSTIILHRAKPGHRFGRNLVSWLGVLICITGVTIVLGYLYASPLLYGGSVKPVALPTAIFMIVLAVGLLAMTGRDVLPYRLFVGPSVRARLMRSFFPPVVTIVLLAGLVEAVLVFNLVENHAVGSSIVTILSAIVFTILVIRLARTIGGDIDRSFSERKRAEEELQRANRALRTLSKCNEVLVHAKSENVLLSEICKVIVEYGGYRLAWVGYAEHDARQTVRPVGYAGFEEGYLEGAHITWSDTERGRGPTGTAIRTGRTATCRNVFTDPSFAPWRDDAAKRGYSSSLVLPLKNTNEVFGALNIYAAEPEAFDEEEVNLLTETADDLAFGIVALRDRLERQRAEQDVRRANAYNRSLIEASLDPLVTIGPDGKILDVNFATQHATGCSHAELVGTDFSEYFTEPEKAKAGYEQVFRVGFVRDYPLELRHRDGHLTSVLYNASLYRDDQGKVLGVFAAARDVTERKRGERALAESEAKFHNLAEQSLVGIAVSNADGYVYVNKRLADIFGYTVEELMHMRPGDTAAPKDRAMVAEMIRKRLTGEIRRTSYTFLGQRKDGSTVDIEIHGSMMEIGGKPATIAVMLDISERKKAEESLRKSEERLRYTMDNMLEGCMIIGHDWTYLYANDAVARHGRQTREHLIGKTMLQLYPGVENTAVFAKYRQSMEQRISQRFESEYTFPDGVSNWFEFSVLPVPEGIFVMTLDITERKHAEEEVRRYRDHLEELVKERTTQLEFANKELESFAYSVSHDLRAPLRGIDGFSQALIEDYGHVLDDQGQDYLRRARAAAVRMSDLIDDMLELSRVGRSEMHIQPVDLSSVVEGIASELQGTDPERNVRFVIEKGITGSGDPRLLKIVLENLVGNAWKFTAKTVHPSIEFGRTEYEGKPTYFVRDNGVGFDMQYADKLFGAFQRLHSTSEFPGTGIGLATVQRIVHRHVGRVWATSTVNHGATFYFTLSEGVKP